MATPTWAGFSAGCLVFGNQCWTLMPKLRLFSKQETISTTKAKEPSKEATGSLRQARTVVHFISTPGGGGAEALDFITHSWFRLDGGPNPKTQLAGARVNILTVVTARRIQALRNGAW
mgnify:CR=1 FL=1